jgi:uncharacterized protein (TIGR00251 family)
VTALPASLRLLPGPGGERTVLEVKVVPGASRSRIAGRHGDGIRVQVAAPPERGRANEELCATLAEALGVRASDVEVLRGATSARKTVLVRTLAPAAVAGRLPS